MTAPTNTVTSATPNVGTREDLEDTITRVAPEETPFTSSLGSTKATAIFHEWQTETLATAVATNAQLEGDDVGTLDAPNLTSRVGNYCQILRKTGGVSRTQEIVDKAGRASEMARQKTLKGIEGRRDFEMRAIGNYASINESGATTRKFGGILAWLTSNTSLGASGANGGFGSGVVAAATNGTQRTFTEALLKSVLATAYSNGGRPTQAFMGPVHKQQASAFTGIADIRADASGTKQATLYAAADMYVSDFGTITFNAHPYGLTRDCVIIDPTKAKVATLDGWKSKELASNGDNEKFMLTAEKTLVCANEKAHAAVRDLL